MDVADLLKTAQGLERRGRTYYMEAAERVSDPVVKAVCVALGRDEEEHGEIVNLFYAALEKTEDWPKPADLDSQPKSARERLDEIVGDTAGAISPGDSYMDVYQSALELERETLVFYKKGEASTDDPALIKFFRYLWHTEKTHAEMLHALLEATRQAAEA